MSSRYRGYWQVRGGIIPGQTEFGREFAIETSYWDTNNGDTNRELFNARRDEAMAYAASMMSPDHHNWVTVEWVWQ